MFISSINMQSYFTFHAMLESILRNLVDMQSDTTIFGPILDIGEYRQAGKSPSSPINALFYSYSNYFSYIIHNEMYHGYLVSKIYIYVKHNGYRSIRKVDIKHIETLHECCNETLQQNSLKIFFSYYYDIDKVVACIKIA